MAKLEDLIGKKFGRLLVLNQASDEESNGNTRWNCLCDCGNKTIVQAAHLKTGSTQSCGCYRKEIAKKRHYSEKCIDLTGKNFGYLIVLEKDHDYVNNLTTKRVYWRCLCTCCGKIILASGTSLRSGKKTSCKTNHLEKGEAGFNFLFRNYKNGAKRRKLEFDLTKEEFKKLTKGNCIYCGSYPNHIHRKAKDEYIYNGIDRVDNSKGYIISNSVSCCETCNTAKKKMTQKEFISWIKKVYNNISNEEYK